MKLVPASTIIFAAALAASTAAAAATMPISGSNGSGSGIQKRQQSPIDGANEITHIGHADDSTSATNNADDSTDDNSEDKGPVSETSNSPTASASEPTTESTSSTSSRTSTSTTSTETHISSSTKETENTKKSTNSDSLSTENSGDDNNNDDESTEMTEEDTTTKPPSESCDNNGEKRCVGSGSNAFQSCEKNIWVNQTCGGSDICGNNNKGEIACIDKNQVIVALEPCSKKNEQRCDASDSSKYQTCDGTYWRTYGCSDNNLCSLVNDKAVCASADAPVVGGDGEYTVESYTLFEPKPFVPLSAATVKSGMGIAAAIFVIVALV
ncbi:hypothetical protein BX661DRAFT_181552 [Kickxella alabastrina]|uniref:uncharacterized protein n=1 Tax=Kickxella alabastrina TaxID=61397 RepID=UPI00221EAFAD|nr:uncharacterized protein BX661DRAFT_181552 [Kickxella alabastrina]KAI7829208.1 hypothetical protein BX661DRAFT_181552 [Kickxella alabastrina]KAJ1947734.1 hypothetical protein GGF37_000110 [Kickxella alabastrina]